ncbi:MAG: D-xylose transport system ATP-binding protein [Acidobacteriaceae bacterium]|nr:D-xylose transport system ATP-binding protein [Acidobacteriaceae bacterium]
MNDLLNAENISKSYGGVRAVEEVSLQVAAGEVVAVVGDNGAGKSTFTKILAGAVRPDSGSLSFERRAVAFHSPKDAQRLGIEMLQQDLALVGDFNAAENLFFGRELSMLGILRGKKMTDQTRDVLQQLGVSLPDSKVPVRYLSGGQRQAVAIGRVLAWGSKVIILDETTAALGVQESRQVLEMIKRMKADGRTIVLITHNMDHVLEVADRVIVMRRGKKVGDLAVGNLQIADIVHLIVAG